MKVIEQLVAHLCATGSLSDMDVAWLREHSYLKSLEGDGEERELDYDSWRDEQRTEEHWRKIDAQITEIELERAKRQAAAKTPHNSKGARKKRRLRKLERGQGIQRRDSRRAKELETRCRNLQHQLSPAMIPALRQALNDVRPPLIAAALELLIKLGVPADEQMQQQLEQLQLHHAPEVVSAATQARMNIHPVDSTEWIDACIESLAHISGQSQTVLVQTMKWLVTLEQASLAKVAQHPHLQRTSSANQFFIHAALHSATRNSDSDRRTSIARIMNRTLFMSHFDSELALVRLIRLMNSHERQSTTELATKFTGICYRYDGSKKNDQHEIRFSPSDSCRFRYIGSIHRNWIPQKAFYEASHWYHLNDATAVTDDIRTLVNRWPHKYNYRFDSRYGYHGLLLNGLTDLNTEDATWLANRVLGDLQLNGIRQLSDAAAQSLSKHQGSRLTLLGLEDLSDHAAQELVQHPGVVSVDNARLSPSAAAIFRQNNL